jgi:hypothetical protein
MRVNTVVMRKPGQGPPDPANAALVEARVGGGEEGDLEDEGDKGEEEGKAREAVEGYTRMPLVRRTGRRIKMARTVELHAIRLMVRSSVMAEVEGDELTGIGPKV